MEVPVVKKTVLSAVFALAFAVAASAQTAAPPKPFEPTVGQSGKDVVWVPTPQPLVDTMLDMAKVTPADVVLDLGSGDGITVITAARRGAIARGVEYDPDMVALSKKNAEAAGVADRATFVKEDLFETDLSKATVITLFLLQRINLQLRPKLLDLKPGTRIVSNSFTMDDWEADETARVAENCDAWCSALMWIVPARVEGTWTMPQGDLTLTQRFQMVSGTLGAKPISEGRLRGDAIVFAVDGVRYEGRVDGDSMQGTTGGQSWTATRRR